MQCFSRGWARLGFGVAIVALLAAPRAFGNAGTLLPLDQYQAGTEQVQNVIVTNGNFESVTAGNPNGWTKFGTFQVAAPTGPNTSGAVNGNFTAQGPLGGSDPNNTPQRSGYKQTVTLQPNTDYFLSGYLWNFSDGTNGSFDLSLVELNDGVGGVRNVSLAADDPFYIIPNIPGNRGVFGYKSFNSSAFASNTIELQVSYEFDSNFPFPHGPDNLAQLDNIAITPANLFVPPSAIPEPASLSLIGLAALGLIRRRRA